MYPSRKEAGKLLQEAEALSPEKAFVLGLLHDIGRRFGVRHLGHVSDGFAYMMSLKFDEIARVCLSHSFNNQTFDDNVGAVDTTDDELKMVRNGLAKMVYDDYDRLIQLCDSIAGAEGVVDMEERMEDVKRRHGWYPQAKWDTNIALKRYFEDIIVQDLYDTVGKASF